MYFIISLLLKIHYFHYIYIIEEYILVLKNPDRQTDKASPHLLTLVSLPFIGLTALTSL